LGTGFAAEHEYAGQEIGEACAAAGSESAAALPLRQFMRAVEGNDHILRALRRGFAGIGGQYGRKGRAGKRKSTGNYGHEHNLELKSGPPGYAPNVARLGANVVSKWLTGRASGAPIRDFPPRPLPCRRNIATTLARNARWANMV